MTIKIGEANFRSQTAWHQIVCSGTHIYLYMSTAHTHCLYNLYNDMCVCVRVYYIRYFIQSVHRKIRYSDARPRVLDEKDTRRRRMYARDLSFAI